MFDIYVVFVIVITLCMVMYMLAPKKVPSCSTACNFGLNQYQACFFVKIRLLDGTSLFSSIYEVMLRMKLCQLVLNLVPI